jgi:hypothetical protein
VEYSGGCSRAHRPDAERCHPRPRVRIPIGGSIGSTLRLVPIKISRGLSDGLAGGGGAGKDMPDPHGPRSLRILMTGHYPLAGACAATVSGISGRLWSRAHGDALHLYRWLCRALHPRRLFFSCSHFGTPTALFRRWCGLWVYRAHTLTKCRLEIGWPTVLAEEIGEGLVGELLEVLHAISSQEIGSIQVSSSN